MSSVLGTKPCRPFECRDIIDGLVARHLACWGWFGLRKLHAAADNSSPTG